MSAVVFVFRQGHVLQGKPAQRDGVVLFLYKACRLEETALSVPSSFPGAGAENIQGILSFTTRT